MILSKKRQQSPFCSAVEGSSLVPGGELLDLLQHVLAHLWGGRGEGEGRERRRVRVRGREKERERARR